MFIYVSSSGEQLALVGGRDGGRGGGRGPRYGQGAAPRGGPGPGDGGKVAGRMETPLRPLRDGRGARKRGADFDIEWVRSSGGCPARDAIGPGP